MNWASKFRNPLTIFTCVLSGTIKIKSQEAQTWLEDLHACNIFSPPGLMQILHPGAIASAEKMKVSLLASRGPLLCKWVGRSHCSEGCVAQMPRDAALPRKDWRGTLVVVWVHPQPSTLGKLKPQESLVHTLRCASHQAFQSSYGPDRK